MSYLDDDSRNADWIKVSGRAREFEHWRGAKIDRECRTAYAAYHADVRARHTAYFETRDGARSTTHDFAAHTTADAFPESWQHLAQVLPENGWHRHHRSGGSSQVLVLALVSAALAADPTLAWLPGNLPGEAAVLFEVELAPDVLNERPRQTSLDVVVTSPTHVIAAEAKFTEKGLGTCSCAGRASGDCSERVLERPYWAVAERDLGLRRESGSCALSLAYQVVRNLAAAAAIADRREAIFLLLFDRRNPYFSGAGQWPGWVDVLRGLSAYSRTSFAAMSWQELLARAPIDEGVRVWAREKHGLEAADVA